jgi:predicted phosphate transport protein (TIGR00153 family)
LHSKINKMSLNSIFQFLVPKDKKFFPLFEQASSNLIELASNLHEAVNLPLKEREVLFQKIDTLEQKGEDITRQTNLELSRNFITPFDREDIHSLITSIDNVADNLHGAASRMRLYQVDKITKSIRKLTEINLEACQNIDVAVKELRNLKNLKNITDACARISKLENKSDHVYNKAVSEIFENETDAKNIIKYKEVLSVLESATDKCKSVASVLESISVKHS